MKDLVIKFNEVETVVKQNRDGLYCLNDIWKAAGGEAKHTPSEYTKYLSDYRTDKYRFMKIRGRNAGTYSNERGVYWYAAKISEEFEDTVFEAFEAAVNGKANEAVDIAQQVARIQSKDVRKNETAAIKAFQLDKGYYNTKLGWSHYGQITNITNKLMGIPTGQRDNLTAEQLINVMNLEKITSKVFKEAIKFKATYGQALELIKKRIHQHMELTG